MPCSAPRTARFADAARQAPLQPPCPGNVNPLGPAGTRTRTARERNAAPADNPACRPKTFPDLPSPFGSPEELSWIKRLRIYTAGLEQLPDWRITCFFVDKECRGRSVSSLVLEGAVLLIAEQCGGAVESCPEDTENRAVSASFLHNGRVAMFERHGFHRVRRIGKNHWVASRIVPAAAACTAAVAR